MKVNDNYQHRRHNKNLLQVHLIFVTKYRKQLFFNSFKNDIKQNIFETSKNHHWYIKKMETDKDHIHILLQYNPTDNVTNIVRILKQYSTHFAWGKYKNILEKEYWKEHTLWSDGYFACSIGEVSQEIIEKYIEGQG